MTVSNHGSLATEQMLQIELEPQDNRRLASLCGELGKHLKIIQNHFAVKIQQRGHSLTLSCADSVNLQVAASALQYLYSKTTQKKLLSPHEVHMSIQDMLKPTNPSPAGSNLDVTKHKQQAELSPIVIATKKAGKITAKGTHQLHYLHNIKTCDVNFGVGPAGTGKTFLAVLCAVEALEQENVQRIILVRPAVEAGESLGFLPGDFSQKVEPYLRPLYDALHDLMGPEWVHKYVERGQIEVAPLAYMRGRTLNDAFIILDEAQNTTPAQMKMFLTRLGFGSTAVITGDMTQIDLPGKTSSGLMHALKVLKTVDGIGITHFTARDAVRHRMVQKIINAYDAHDASTKK